MPEASPLFVDTNALIYANVQESPLHSQALSALEAAYGSGRPVWISRQIVREYIAVMTRHDMLSVSQMKSVLSQVEQFIGQFKIANETSAVTEFLLTLLDKHQCGGKQVHDANIVATMLCYDIRHLLTANVSDFKRFDSIIEIEELVSV